MQEGRARPRRPVPRPGARSASRSRCSAGDSGASSVRSRCWSPRCSSIPASLGLFTPRRAARSRSPDCGTNDVMILMAQSVPTARRAVHRRPPAGWERRRRAVANGADGSGSTPTSRRPTTAVEVAAPSRATARSTATEVPATRSAAPVRAPDQLPPDVRATCDVPVRRRLRHLPLLRLDDGRRRAAHGRRRQRSASNRDELVEQRRATTAWPVRRRRPPCVGGDEPDPPRALSCIRSGVAADRPSASSCRAIATNAVAAAARHPARLGQGAVRRRRRLGDRRRSSPSGVNDWDWGADGLALHLVAIGIPATMAAAVTSTCSPVRARWPSASGPGWSSPAPAAAVRRRIAVLRRYRELVGLCREQGFGPFLSPTGPSEPRTDGASPAPRARGGRRRLRQARPDRRHPRRPAAPDVCDELAELQNRVPPEPPSGIAAVLEAELGRPVDEVFAEFDWEPLAAASIGQTYGARLAHRGGGRRQGPAPRHRGE